MNNEVYFCGKCRRQQQPKEGEQCKICKKITVSWYTNTETEAEALLKWVRINARN